MNEIKTTTVAKINNVEILLIENGEKRVAVKPICEALGVDYSSQLQKLKSDPILSSTMGLSTTVGADGKDREMQTIPFMYVFGWLFNIDSRNVKEEAREVVLKYQVECYKALYYHFTNYAEFVEQKQKAIEAQLEIVDSAKTNFRSAKSVLDEADKHLKSLRQLAYADFDAERRQLKMFTEKEMGGKDDE
jgi:hypothetical protein